MKNCGVSEGDIRNKYFSPCRRSDLHAILQFVYFCPIVLLYALRN